MARETLQAWAKRFVADLTVDGEVIPLDRALRKHLLTLFRFRNDGLTWTSIADAVRQAGARRKNGKPFTAAQLRADVSRLSRAQAVGERSHLGMSAVVQRGPTASDGGRPVPVRAASVVRTREPLPASAPTPAASDEVSDAELMRVRARLDRT